MRYRAAGGFTGTLGRCGAGSLVPGSTSADTLPLELK